MRAATQRSWYLIIGLLCMGTLLVAQLTRPSRPSRFQQATLTISNLNQTYNGTQRSVTVTTSPAGLTPVTVTYDGSAVSPVNAGNYAVAATLSNSQYVGSASGTLVIAKANQVITFAAIPNQLPSNPPFTVTATSSSGLPISFSASGTCTVAGNTVNITSNGSCSITASQAGGTNFNAATSVTRTFTIGQAAATLTLGNLNQTFDGTPKAISVTTAPFGLSGVSVTYNGSATAPSAIGSYAVIASLTNIDYTAPGANGTLVISKGNQTINFAALPSRIQTDPPFTVSAFATSGLAVTFSATGTCSVAGNTVTIGNAGSCTITASQAGNGNFNAAPDVAQSFTIFQGVAMLAISNTAQTYDGAPKPVTVTTNPAGLTTVSVTYNGSAVVPTSAGSYAVVASLSNPNFFANNSSDTLVIGKANQTITFGALPNRQFGDAQFGISASSSSGMTVTFAASSNCSVAGSTVTITGAGSCTITASQPGDTNFNPAPAIQQSFSIAQGVATLSLSNLNVTYDGTPKSATVTTSPPGLPGVTVTYNGSSTPPITASNYSVSANLSNPNYTAAPASGFLVINPAVQSINFGALASKTFGDPAFTVSASASSGLAVSFSASGNCTISGNTVTLTASGSCTITASQDGNVNYNPAPDVGQSFTIAAPPPPPPTNPAPVITKISPESSIAAGGGTIIITGANFVTGATVRFSKTGISPFTLSNIVVVSSTKITATVPPGTTGDLISVIVRNPDGQQVTKPNGFRYGKILLQTNFTDGFNSLDARVNLFDITLDVNHFVSPPFGVSGRYVICGDPLNAVCGAAHQDINRWIEVDMTSTDGFPDGLSELFVKGKFFFQHPAAGASTDVQRKIFFLKDPSGPGGVPNQNWSIVLTSDTISGKLGLRLAMQSTALTYGMFGGSNELGNRSILVNGIKELQFDRWYTLQVQVRRKSGTGAQDSIVRLWVDGNLEFERTTWIPTGPCSSATSQVCPAFPPDGPNFTKGITRIEIGTQVDRQNYRVVDEYRFMDDIAVADAYIPD
jgi:hypothetical protein